MQPRVENLKPEEEKVNGISSEEPGDNVRECLMSSMIAETSDKSRLEADDIESHRRATEETS